MPQRQGLAPGDPEFERRHRGRCRTQRTVDNTLRTLGDRAEAPRAARDSLEGRERQGRPGLESSLSNARRRRGAWLSGQRGVTSVWIRDRLTVASAASGAKRRESAARGVRHGELWPEPLMNTESKPLRGVRGGSRAPPVQPHRVKRGGRTRRQHGATKRRPRARSRGRDACRALSRCSDDSATRRSGDWHGYVELPRCRALDTR